MNRKRARAPAVGEQLEVFRFSAKERATLCQKLAQRKIGTADQREKFLDFAQESITILKAVTTDGKHIFTPAATMRSYLEDIRRAAAALRKAIYRCDDQTFTLLLQHLMMIQRVPTTGYGVVDGWLRNGAADIVAACEQMSKELKTRPGPHNPVIQYFIRGLADCWRLAFGQKAHASRIGPFASMLECIAVIAASREPRLAVLDADPGRRPAFSERAISKALA